MDTAEFTEPLMISPEMFPDRSPGEVIKLVLVCSSSEGVQRHLWICNVPDALVPISVDLERLGAQSISYIEYSRLGTDPTWENLYCHLFSLSDLCDTLYYLSRHGYSDVHISEEQHAAFRHFIFMIGDEIRQQDPNWIHTLGNLRATLDEFVYPYVDRIEKVARGLVVSVPAVFNSAN